MEKTPIVLIGYPSGGKTSIIDYCFTRIEESCHANQFTEVTCLIPGTEKEITFVDTVSLGKLYIERQETWNPLKDCPYSTFAWVNSINTPICRITGAIKMLIHALQDKDFELLIIVTHCSTMRYPPSKYFEGMGLQRESEPTEKLWSDYFEWERNNYKAVFREIGMEVEVLFVDISDDFLPTGEYSKKELYSYVGHEPSDGEIMRAKEEYYDESQGWVTWLLSFIKTILII